MSLELLGHIISEEGISTDPRKIEFVRAWPTPSNIMEVRSFLRLRSYYRRFVENFSKITKPLFRLFEKNVKFVSGEECENAFGTPKKMFTESPVVSHPDFSKSFILDTDACNESIGPVISQKTHDKEVVVAYASRTLTKSERKYCVTCKEMLALVHFVKYFRHLIVKPFLVRTDHGSLRRLMNFKNPEGQVARWLENLSSYNFRIEYRPGRLYGNADGVSRIPCRQCGQIETINENQQQQISSLSSVDNTNYDSTADGNLPLKDAQNVNQDISKGKQ